MHLIHLREPVNAWSHIFGLLMAMLGTVVLWRRSRGGKPDERFSLVVFGLCLTFCYAASALYHALRLPESRLAPFDRLDRIGIFLLIAGSYTPIAWCLLRGWWRAATLASVWLVAAVSSLLLAMGHPLSTPLGTGLYLAMGWGSAACYAELTRVVSHRDLFPLVVGGLLYSVGATINLIGWPVLAPGSFGAHELFHLFVLSGSFVHFRFILQVVIPFEQWDSKVQVGGANRQGFGVS